LPAFSALNQLDCYVLVNVLPADKLFRINNVAKRKKYADLVEGVCEAGGEALLFSSMHVSGEQLNNLSGIAAVLRFPLPELEDQEIVEEV
jgi:protein pelota